PQGGTGLLSRRRPEGEKNVLSREVDHFAIARGRVVPGAAGDARLEVLPALRFQVERPEFVALRAAAVQDQAVPLAVVSQAGYLIEVLGALLRIAQASP